MLFAVKLLISNLVIVTCAWIGRRSPTLAGLLATMPLTTIIVLLWLYSDNPGDYRLLTTYTRGVLWGIVPTILFFLVSYLCFLREIAIAPALLAGSAVWVMAALVHQWCLR